MDVNKKCYSYKIISWSKSGFATEFLCDNSDVALEQCAVLINDFRNSKVEIFRGCFYVL